MSHRFRWFVAAWALTFSGCATTGGSFVAPAPEEVPVLEQLMMQDPSDVETGLYLATGYREAGRLDEARALVASLTAVDPEDPGLMVMQGLLDEDIGDHNAAVSSYQRFLDTGTQGPLRDQVLRRIELARMEALRADVRSALAREEALAQTEPDASTVGIFPFVFEGDDPEYEPLALVLPDLLTTDLAVTGRLTLVERTKIQALIRELQLGESGRVEASTAARSGRLLGSGHIVQGRFRMDQGTRVDVDAALVTVGRPGQELADPLVAQDEIERFFDMEKRLAFAIYEELGIQLTPAERERVNERPTESIEALLAYGRGLAAEDAGDFGQAQQHFADAEALDPGFSLARMRRLQAQRILVRRVDVPAAQLPRLVHRVGLRQDAVRRLTDVPVGMRERVLARLAAHKRSILAEVLGQDRVGQAILLELIFTVPGGGP